MRGYNLQEPLLRYWEDCGSLRRRTFSRRLREVRVRAEGFRRLGMGGAAVLPYVGKPLLAAAIPGPVHHYVRRHRFWEQGENCRGLP